ncbi:MAG: flagellar protein FlgN [Verrucomicrobiota bacterium]
MIEKIEGLVEALRNELQHYGEMLALLDQQQELVAARAAQDLLQSIADIQAQGLTIQAARGHREACRRGLAQQLLQPSDIAFNELILLLPADYQPLVQALVQENNELLVRVQQRARQNHLLLSRSLELMQRFLTMMFPSRETLVYNGNGAMLGPALPSRSIYDAVG